MKYKSIASKIIELKNADLKLRELLIQRGQLGNGYNEEMETLHNKNAEILNGILETIGYPTIVKVGEEASEAAWLVIQHAIGKPKFMKRCLNLLNDAVIEHEAHPKHLAYLSDRIAFFEGKDQLFGTQFDWTENGELFPCQYDDLGKVNERRKSIGLNSLEEQTEIIRRQAEVENETTPKDYHQRKRDFDEWRKSVGWTDK